MSRVADLGLLLRLDRRRLAAAVRRPTLSAAVTLLGPLLMVAALLWGRAERLVPAAEAPGDAAALGMLISGPIALLAYPVLLRGGDEPLLRRLGVDQAALFLERAARLLGTGAVLGALAVALALPAGRGAGVAAVTVAAVAVAVGSGAAATALAARMLAGPAAGGPPGCLSMGMWDREVAAVAPLVYAPLVPLLAGAVTGALVAAAPGAGWGRAAAASALGVLLTALAARWWADAAPRFGPRALEMAFSPGAGAGGEMRIGRGVAGVVPRPVAAAWARDGAVGARRFGWATRVVWPVAVIGFFALARWGADPVIRGAVTAAAGLVLLLQAAAMVGLGRWERRGARWLDRALGISPVARLAGRWAWGWGMALWLALPLGLAWSWWTQGGELWPWLLAPAATAGAAAGASVLAAGWR